MCGMLVLFERDAVCMAEVYNSVPLLESLTSSQLATKSLSVLICMSLSHPFSLKESHYFMTNLNLLLYKLESDHAY